MLSLQKNFLFIHVHKTGGNSIQSALLKYSEDRLEYLSHSHKTKDFEIKNADFPSLKKHSTLEDYQQVLSPEIFQKLYKFACVRNPWERMISFYFSPHRGDVDWSKENFIKLIETIPPVINFLTTKKGNSSKKKIEVDFIIKFENLPDDFDCVCQEIGLPKIDLPLKNKSERKPYLDYYDKDLIKLVERKFADDINLFGYVSPLS